MDGWLEAIVKLNGGRTGKKNTTTTTTTKQSFKSRRKKRTKDKGKPRNGR